MPFRKLLPLVAVFALVSCGLARAQFALYGTVEGERMSGFTCQATVGTCASSNGVVKPFGGNFGLFYDFHTLGPLRLGVDLRGDILSSNKSAVSYQGGSGVVKQYGALGGLRASIGVPLTILHPYAEVAAGYAKTNAASTDVEIYSNYTQVKGMLGLDITLLPFLDLRAIEVGAGALFGPNTHSTASIGAGVVFHVP